MRLTDFAGDGDTFCEALGSALRELQRLVPRPLAERLIERVTEDCERILGAIGRHDPRMLEAALTRDDAVDMLGHAIVAEAVAAYTVLLGQLYSWDGARIEDGVAALHALGPCYLARADLLRLRLPETGAP
jgi:hypothetical protein